MTISERVKSQFFENEERLIRLAPSNTLNPGAVKRNGKPWTPEEHHRFLEALERYPSGPWKVVASFVGTRTTRQTMTHAQKYRERIARMKRDEEQFVSEAAAAADLGSASVPRVSAKHVASAEENSTGEFAISAVEMERFDATLLPLFQSADLAYGSLDDLADDLDDDFINECLDQLVRHEHEELLQ